MIVGAGEGTWPENGPRGCKIVAVVDYGVPCDWLLHLDFASSYVNLTLSKLYFIFYIGEMLWVPKHPSVLTGTSSEFFRYVLSFPPIRYRMFLQEGDRST